MKEKIFIDSDIILDVALNREPHFLPSSIILTLTENKKIYGYTSSVIISNLYYVLRKIESHKSAVKFIAQLRTIVKILPVTDEIVRLSTESKFNDFEDGLQYYCALINKVDFLITRNVKDYIKEDIKVHTPEEYIKLKEIEKKMGQSDIQ
jgi:predicted nucleic acid-binding protein